MKLHNTSLITIIAMCVISSILAPAQVNTVWLKRYNGPGNSSDSAYVIAIDATGCVYVAGSSIGAGTDADYATIKYYPNGDTVWVGRYNGPGTSSLDRASAMTVDNAGNVYVTGWSTSDTIYCEYATIKYDSAGAQQWAARYHDPMAVLIFAYAIAVDDAGYVYVTGGFDGDFGTIKYNAGGDTVWVRRYTYPVSGFDVPSAIAVDPADNVYVTGLSEGAGTGFDYATIKYNSIGDTKWIMRYHGGDSDDYPTGIALDPAGNVYVTGYSWGNGTGGDFATIKYDSTGIQQWVARYHLYSNDAPIGGIVVDDTGCVYVTGWSYGSSANTDIATIKYRSNGDTAWVRRYNGPANNNDLNQAIALDTSGNVYVTGYSVGSGTGSDYVTIKYDALGVQQWVIGYNGPGNDEDYAYDITVDDTGCVYVTGYSIGSGTSTDFVTIKYAQVENIEENGGTPSIASKISLLYPNPAQTYCTIRASGPAGISTVKIYDVTGKKIKEIIDKQQKLEICISLTGIAPGVYFIKVNDTKITGKIIITN